MEPRLRKPETEDADAWIPTHFSSLPKCMDQALDVARELVQDPEITDVSVVPEFANHPNHVPVDMDAPQVLHGYGVHIWGGRMHSWFAIPDDVLRQRLQQKRPQGDQGDEGGDERSPMDEHTAPVVEPNPDPERALLDAIIGHWSVECAPIPVQPDGVIYGDGTSL